MTEKMKCEQCGYMRDDVEVVADPYEQEFIGDENHKYITEVNVRALCGQCYQDLCKDI